MPKLKISFFQYCPIFNEVNKNLINVINLLSENSAEINKSDVVIFPEYFLSGSLDLNHFEEYKNQLKNLDLIERLKLLSKEYKNTTFIFGSCILPSSVNGKFGNISLAVCNGEVLASYDKKALIYNENYTCIATDNYPIFDVKGIKIGLTICWDTILPEVYRHYVKKADLVITPAFWGIGGNALQAKYPQSLEKTYYRQLLVTRAYENAFATLFVNSVGQYKSPFYSDRMMGGSLAVMPPIGEVFFTNSKKASELQSLELDFSYLSQYREFYATDQDFLYYKSKNIF